VNAEHDYIAVYEDSSEDGGAEDVKLLKLFQKQAVLGTSKNADIRLNNFRCHRFHAIVTALPNKRYHLVDLCNGTRTFVDGKIVKEIIVSEKEIITLGSTKLFFKQVPKALIKYQPEGDTTSDDSANETSPRSLITDNTLLQINYFWGNELVESTTFRNSKKITIGSSQCATFAIGIADLLIFQLAKFKGESVEIFLHPEIRGFVRVDSITVDIETLPKDKSSVILRMGDSADIIIGDQSLSFKFVTPALTVPRTDPLDIDRRFAKILIGSIAFILIFIFLMILSPHLEKDEPKPPEVPEKIMKVLYEAGIKNAMEHRQSAIGEFLKQTGGRARAESGQSKSNKVPKPEVKPPTKVSEVTPVKEESQNEKLTIATQKDNEKRHANMEKAFANNKNSSLSDDSALEGDLQRGNTLSALKGGNFAKGREGFGAGGGGKGVGVGSLDGFTTGGGMGAGDYGLAPSKGRDIDIKEREDVVLLDGLDPDVIAAVIKRYLPQIEHCYESGLIKKPTLKGKVQVAFQITANGTTKSGRVLETTLKDETTESCILKKITGWKFPNPRGGGVVDVKYPFLLMSTKDSEQKN